MLPEKESRIRGASVGRMVCGGGFGSDPNASSEWITVRSISDELLLRAPAVRARVKRLLAPDASATMNSRKSR